MTKKRAAAPEDAPLELGGDPHPSLHGGAYVDGERVEGQKPDYGFVMHEGKRVPAGPDGKPRQPKE